MLLFVCSRVLIFIFKGCKLDSTELHKEKEHFYRKAPFPQEPIILPYYVLFPIYELVTHMISMGNKQNQTAGKSEKCIERGRKERI